MEQMHLLIGQMSKHGYKLDLNMGHLKWQPMGRYRLQVILCRLFKLFRTHYSGFISCLAFFQHPLKLCKLGVSLPATPAHLQFTIISVSSAMSSAAAVIDSFWVCVFLCPHGGVRHLSAESSSFTIFKPLPWPAKISN